MEKQGRTDTNNKVTSGFLTLGVTGGLLVAMLLLSFRPPNPPMVEPEGLTVDFGQDLTGFGIEEPSSQISGGAPAHKPVVESAVTQQNESTITVPDKKNTTKPTTQTTTTSTQQNTNTINSNELFDPSKLNNKGNSGSEGTAGGTGNEGSPDGDPNGYHGPGAGRGDNGSVGWNLDGRSMKAPPTLQVDHNEIGDIRVKIYVDRNGKVTKAEYERSGSTITDSYLISQSKNAAMKATFNVDKNAPEVQIGYMTFHFKLQ
ncbi:MAG TPA: energy transducer TonB [Chitinophagales bacterium]|nr:hypothetical protein [Chitinophagales bacterium]HMU69155.1 energy transducer TonB [Chitinophagales bacterium]HMZ90539.1 energy transducer TonB [Chitinophagales bacterium]HNA58355.1 energy transducer TonB [Chitinophagales bacterium]HNE46235.1 energy transducer TonB [Chitinophagales bacterium]